ncbi:MAG: dTDP-4-dehydrorhamnose reductase [Candidatus Acidoferrum typicum]|nr:dTDP-4-dehydrorhamnose reductase [Candidatus Acidoferrum typicum]
MKPTILLTGRTGQLGSELSRLLPKLGEVIAPERNELDLREPEKIREIMRNAKPQVVVNAAAYTAVDAAETDEAAASIVNAEAPRLLALEAKKLGALLVHFSTDYVFDGSKTSPYLETDSPNPINSYGRTKLAGEEAIRNSGVSHLIFRTSWVYATHGKNFLRTILRLATEREELKIVADQAGAPTCAFDLAEATTKIVDGIVAAPNSELAFQRLAGTYHMTAAGQTTWYEFAKAILKEASRAPKDLPWLTSATNARPIIARRVLPISTGEFRSPTRRPAYSVLSNAHLLQQFGATLPDWRIQVQRCFSASTR